METTKKMRIIKSKLFKVKLCRMLLKNHTNIDIVGCCESVLKAQVAATVPLGIRCCDFLYQEQPIPQNHKNRVGCGLRNAAAADFKYQSQIMEVTI